jgi:hypothetical protein
MILGTLVPATTTHPKLLALVRNKKNMYGTWYKAHVIPEKLTVKMGNNGHQHLTRRGCSGASAYPAASRNSKATTTTTPIVISAT